MKNCRTCFVTNHLGAKGSCDVCSDYYNWVPDVDVGTRVKVIAPVSNRTDLVGRTGKVASVCPTNSLPVLVDFGSFLWWCEAVSLEPEDKSCLEIREFKHGDLHFTLEGKVLLKGRQIDSTKARSIERYISTGVKPNSKLLKALVEARLVRQLENLYSPTYVNMHLIPDISIGIWGFGSSDIPDDVIVISRYVPGIEKNIRKGRIAFDTELNSKVIYVSPRYYRAYTLRENDNLLRFFKALFKGVEAPTTKSSNNTKSVHNNACYDLCCQ